jgi:hypothetical protein
METRCRGYMRVPVLSTQASHGAENAPSLVCPYRAVYGTWRLTGWTGVLSDATKSVSRAYINNFQDKGKQIAIDMFLVRIYTFLSAFLH